MCRTPKGSCLSCGDSVSYRPTQHGLMTRRVEVWGLLPHTTYTFTIQALNGVSQLSTKDPASESVNITTSHDGKTGIAGKVYIVRTLCGIYKCFCHLRSAIAGVCDSEERLHREQFDSSLVSPGAATQHHPAVSAALLWEGKSFLLKGHIVFRFHSNVFRSPIAVDWTISHSV